VMGFRLVPLAIGCLKKSAAASKTSLILFGLLMLCIQK